MAYTKLNITSGILFLLMCSLLLMIQPAYSAPVLLEDNVMEQVTAGNTHEGGGVIVAKS